MSFSPILEGAALQSGLIVALGAQNLFVLENGLSRRHLALAPLICSLVDLFLIALGVLGAGALFARSPLSKIAMGALGVLFLFRYAWRKLRESTRPETAAGGVGPAPRDGKAVALAALGFSLLNPHVYLDAIVLVGGYSCGFASVPERVRFGLGAVLFSAAWFFSLSYGAGLVGGWLGDRKARRRIGVVSAAVLFTLGVLLAAELVRWISAWLTP